MTRTLTKISILCATLAVAACGGDGEWRNAQKLNTIEAYEAYIAENPDATHLDEARKKLEELVKAKAIAAEKEKERLFVSLEEDIRGFINQSDSNIVAMNGKSRDDQNFLFGIISGGFDILNGRSTPRPGSVIVYESPDKTFLVTGVADQDGRTLTNIESTEFQIGAKIEFTTGEIYEYGEDGWVRLEDQP